MKNVRNFVRQESRKLGKGNILVIASMFLCFWMLSSIKTSLCTRPTVNLKLPRKATVKIVMAEVEKTKIKKHKPVCDVSGERSDICEIEGDVRIQGNYTAIFIPHSSKEQREWKIKPYARKGNGAAMANVKEFLLKPLIGCGIAPPMCTQNHSVPAVIFSIGGFTGNPFHDFTDVLIPLFTTSRKFDREVQFLVMDSKPWWLNKYISILKRLSKYEIIELEGDTETVHCFQRAFVGTNFHKELGILPSRSSNGYSILDFKELLRESFLLKKVAATTITTGDQMGRKPRLLIISRKRSRAFLNERGIVEMAKSLGYDVVVAEPDMDTDLSKFARLVNSCDVMMGVHGAGLTNMVFLPLGAVVIQIIPLGHLEWLARDSFMKPAMDMKLSYLDYRIQAEESSLIEQYPHEHPIIKDPFSVHKQGWDALKSVYLDNQSVRPHLGKLRTTLLEALKLLHHHG